MLLIIITLILSCHGDYPGTIYGPRNFDSKIAVIGGDVDGINMALQLRKNGFTNVTVYEMTTGLGSRFISNTVHGSVFHPYTIIPPGDTEMKSIADEYLSSGDVIKMPEMTIWSSIEGSDRLDEMSVKTYLTEYGKKIFNVDSEETANLLILNKMVAYSNFHRNELSTSTEENWGILEEPSWKIRRETYGSISDFLLSQQLEVLKPIFVLHMTLFGLGHPDDVAALYGLIHVTADIMDAYRYTVSPNGASKPEILNSYIIRGGYESLFSAIASIEKLRILKQVKVDRLRRTSLSKVSEVFLRLRSTLDQSTTWETYDFAIWSANLRSAVTAMSWETHKYAGPSKEEYQNFLRIKEQLYRHVTLFDSENTRRGGTPIDVFIDDVMGNKNGVAVLYDTYALLNEQLDENRYRNTNYPINALNSNIRTMQAVQYTVQKTIPQNGFSNAFQLVPRTNFSIIATNTWSSNPHFDEKDMRNGMPWTLLSMQGKYGLWYAGRAAVDSAPISKKKLVKTLVQDSVFIEQALSSSALPSVVPRSSYMMSSMMPSSSHMMSSMTPSSSDMMSSMMPSSSDMMSSMMPSSSHMMSSMMPSSSDMMSSMMPSSSDMMSSMMPSSSHMMSSMMQSSSDMMSSMMPSSSDMMPSMMPSSSHMISSMMSSSSDMMASMMPSSNYMMSSMMPSSSNVMSSMILCSNNVMSSMMPSSSYMMSSESSMMGSASYNTVPLDQSEITSASYGSVMKMSADNSIMGSSSYLMATDQSIMPSFSYTMSSYQNTMNEANYMTIPLDQSKTGSASGIDYIIKPTASYQGSSSYQGDTSSVSSPPLPVS